MLTIYRNYFETIKVYLHIKKPFWTKITYIIEDVVLKWVSFLAFLDYPLNWKLIIKLKINNNNTFFENLFNILLKRNLKSWWRNNRVLQCQTLVCTGFNLWGPLIQRIPLGDISTQCQEEPKCPKKPRKCAVLRLVPVLVFSILWTSWKSIVFFP